MSISLRRFAVSLGLVVALAPLVASCSGGSLPFKSQTAPAAVHALAPIAPANTIIRTNSFNGTWGTEYGEGVNVNNNSGSNSAGDCSGGASGYSCGQYFESVKSATLPSLSVTAPPPDAPASASGHGSVSMGAFHAHLYSMSGFIGPGYTADSTTYIEEAWTDEITPAPATATDPVGTPLTYEASISVTYSDTLDCVGSDYFEVSVSGTDFHKDLIDDIGCGQTTPAHFIDDVKTTYGANPLTINATLVSFVQTATTAAHTSSTSNFPKINVQFHFANASDAPYSTASGVCYGAGCT